MNLFNQDTQERKFIKIPVKDGELWYMEHFMPLNIAQTYYNTLSNTITWKQETITLYGKTHTVPRKTAWYGNKGTTYRYSGITHDPEPWTKALLDIKKVIEHVLNKETFNSVLLNLYRNGNDKMGWHADNEKELGTHPTIASVSLGATRRFDLKHKTDSKQKIQLQLRPGSLIIMRGALQHHWLHQIPAQKKITNSRINLTYRNIIK